LASGKATVTVVVKGAVKELNTAVTMVLKELC
jgi:hypothetical protein